MLNKLAVAASGLTLLCGSALAQDAKAVIANAQKALGDVKSITYSGSAKDVAFQQCGANSTDMMCRGTHDPMRPINNYVRVIDLTGPASRATGATNNIGAGGSTTLTPGRFFQQVTAQLNDRTVLSAQWGPSVAKNPYLQFRIKGGAAGDRVTISWTDNRDQTRTDSAVVA